MKAAVGVVTNAPMTPGGNTGEREVLPDEINISVPQSLSAQAELRHLLAAGDQIISGANSTPITGLLFNCIGTAYLACKDHDKDPSPVLTQGEWDDTMEMFLVDDSYLRTLPTRLAAAGIPPRSPRAILSSFMPDTLYYHRMEKKVVNGVIQKNEVRIVNGVVVQGNLEKTDVANRLIQTIHLRYGPAVTSRFISEGTQILDWYLEKRSFTISLHNCLIGNYRDARGEINGKIDEIEGEIDVLNKNPPNTQFEAEYRENEIQSILDSIKNIGSRLATDSISGEDNALGTMIMSGMKGSIHNIAQIAGALGEQFINGKRPKPGMYGERTLPYFEAGDASIDMRGFVRNSFANGMSPAEFIFHMGATRVGLIEGAVKTADIGAINHRMQKVLENMRLGYYGNIINNVFVIMSPTYGSGYSPTETTFVSGFNTTGPLYMPFNLRALVDEIETNAGVNTKRNILTEEEINRIASRIPRVTGPVADVTNHLNEEIQIAVRLQLSEIPMAKSTIFPLMARIYNRCMRAEEHPGTPVGLRAAEAIGQPITQATLNAFHFTASRNTGGGSTNVFAEILNLSQNRKNKLAHIHFKDENLSYSDAYALSKAFTAYSVKDLITDIHTGIKIMSHPSATKDREFESWYRHFTAFTDVPEKDRIWLLPSENPVNYLRLEFEPYRLYEARISTADLAAAISESGGVRCVYSPTRIGIVDVYAKPEITKEVKQQMGAPSVSDDAPKRRGKKKANTLAAEVEKRLEKKEKRAAEKMARALGKKTKFVVPEPGKPVDPIRTAIDKVVEYQKSAEGIAMTRAGVTTSNAVVLFLQLFVVPRIIYDTLVVSSSHSAAKMQPANGVFVPKTARNLALFRAVDITRVDTTTAILGSTKLTDTRHRIWVNTVSVASSGISREKIGKLASAVTGGDYFLAEPFRGTHAYPDGDYVDVDVKIKMDPGASLSSVISSAVMSSREEFEDKWKIQKAKYAKRPYDMVAEPSDVLTHSEYIFLTGNLGIAPALKRLLIHPLINPVITTTNNPHEISETYGIENARMSVFQEIYSTIIGLGSSINPNHVQVVVDVMTSSGTLMPFTARGSARQGYGAYSESSFEPALPVFTRSAVSGAQENVSAMSTSILTGSLVPLGTGCMKVIPTCVLPTPARARVSFAETAEAMNAGGADSLEVVEGFLNSSHVTEALALTFSSPDTEIVSFSFPPPVSSALVGTLSNRNILSK